MKKHFTSVFSAILGGAIALGGYHFIIKEKEDNSFSFSSQKTDTTGAIHTNFQQVANFNFDENSFINASNKTVNSVVHVKNMTVAPLFLTSSVGILLSAVARNAWLVQVLG